MANSEGRALVFGRGVSVSVLGREREAESRGVLQLRRQPLVQRLLRRPQALALLIQHTQQTLRPLQDKEADALVLSMCKIFTRAP